MWSVQLLRPKARQFLFGHHHTLSSSLVHVRSGSRLCENPIVKEPRATISH